MLPTGLRNKASKTWKKGIIPGKEQMPAQSNGVDLEKLAERIVEKLRDTLVQENERSGRA